MPATGAEPEGEDPPDLAGSAKADLVVSWNAMDRRPRIRGYWGSSRLLIIPNSGYERRFFRPGPKRSSAPGLGLYGNAFHRRAAGFGFSD